MEDLDPAVADRETARCQERDLRRLGLDWDGPVVHQSGRADLYAAAIDDLRAMGLTYPCYCTRREIHEAARAPQEPITHDRTATAPRPDGAYPGTCRELATAERSRLEHAGRPAALRLRADDAAVEFVDLVAGTTTGTVDDIVLRRNDGVAAYNVAVVVDDAAQGVEEVVRGDDLLIPTVRHIHLQQLLGLPVPRYAHVPLAVGPDGARLAKRHGAVTLDDRRAAGEDVPHVLRRLATSAGLSDPLDGSDPAAILAELLVDFEVALVRRGPWVVDD